MKVSASDMGYARNQNTEQSLQGARHSRRPTEKGTATFYDVEQWMDRQTGQRRTAQPEARKRLQSYYL